jgi:hypothetical protein
VSRELKVGIENKKGTRKEELKQLIISTIYP